MLLKYQCEYEGTADVKYRFNICTDWVDLPLDYAFLTRFQVNANVVGPTNKH